MKHLLPLCAICLLTLLNLSCAQEQTASSSTPKEKLKFTSSLGCIYQDQQGNYWLGSAQEGACLFDGKTFRYFSVEEGLIDPQIRSIQEDEYGNIWLGTAHGISRFDGQKITSYAHKLLSNMPYVWMKSPSDLWFNAGIQTGVYRYDGQQINYLAFPEVNNTTTGQSNALTDMSKGKHNRIWLSTYAGLFGYDGQGFTVINDASLGFKQQGELLHIRSVLEDSKERVWIGNNGIGVLLHEGDSTYNFSQKMGLIHANSLGRGDKSPPNTLEHVFAIAEDKKGNIWFGDRDTGLWKYDGQSMVNCNKTQDLSSNFVTEIYEDQQGLLWIGLQDGGLYTFDGQKLKKIGN